MSNPHGFSKVRVPEILRSDVQIRADTANAETRTVEIVWAAGAPVQRYDYWEGESYIEELSMDPTHIRMERFASGMSLLDSHSPYSMDDRLGVVLPGSVRIEGGLGIATVQFSKKQRAEELFQDVRDGMPFPVSVGYKTHAYTRTDANENSIARLTATDWEPMELSAVPIPADPAARSRGEQSSPDPILVDITVAARQRAPSNQDNDMSRHHRSTSPSSSTAPTLSGRQREMARIFPKPDAVRAFVAAARDERIDPEEFVAATRGMNELQVRAALLDQIVDLQERAPTFPHSPARTSSDGADDLQARGEALFARANPGHKLSERARQYANLLPAEHGRDLLRASGENVVGMSHAGLITRALHSTSDFPLVIVAAGGMAVKEGYAQLDTEIRQTARPTTLENFKTHHSVNLSSAPRLLKVNEHGEYRRGTFLENAEGYGLSTFGRIIGVTRQLLINDDLNVFSRIPQRLGQSAREFELSSLVALIEGNPTMSDGFEVFSSEHANLGVGAALSVASLSAARLAMRRQTGLAGEAIGVRPRFLIVPSELETIAEQVLAEIAARAVNEVNPFAGKLILIVEHRLADPAAWYLAADPAQIDGLEFAHLAGQEGPYIESKAGWDVDGVEIKVRLDYGAGWVDHRAWFKNPGA